MGQVVILRAFVPISTAPVLSEFEPIGAVMAHRTFGRRVDVDAVTHNKQVVARACDRGT